MTIKGLSNLIQLENRDRNIYTAKFHGDLTCRFNIL